MVSLSTSDPTVSAIAVGLLRGMHTLAHRFINALDQVIAPLIQLIHAPFGCGHLVIISNARTILLVPQFDVGGRELRHQTANSIIHVALPRCGPPRARVLCRPTGRRCTMP